MAALADEQEFCKVLYWGAYGTGKTTDMAYLAHSGLTKWVRVDPGIKAGPLRRMGIPVDNVDVISELRPDGLLRLIEEWRGMLHDDPKAIAGVVVDTMTELVARRIEVYVDQAWKEYVARSNKQHTEIDRSLRYSVAETRDLYLPVSQELGRLIRHIVDLPCHAAFSAQIRRDTDKNTGHTQYGPAANPAVQGQLIGYCDLVIETAAEGRYEDGDEEDCFVGHPKPRPGREGKDRFGVLPRVLVSPTMDRVIGYVRGDLDYRTDPVQARYRELVKVRKARAKAEDDEL